MGATELQRDMLSNRITERYIRDTKTPGQNHRKLMGTTKVIYKK
jgi:hypothetical protein